MGGGLCWIDYDADGWLDLFAVNAYADEDYVRWTESGGLPRSALFHNVRGRFVDVGRGSGADLQLRGNGCVAADFNLDGNADLYVTTAGYNAATNGYDALLWGNGDGTFTEGARKAGINAPGWHAGAAVGDVNGDGLPDLFVAGYTDTNTPIPGVRGRVPEQPRGRARPPLPQPRPGRERPLPVPRGRPARRPRAEARRPRPGRRLHGRRRRRPARPLRRQRPRPEPALPERPQRRARLPPRRAGTSEGVDDPNAGMGIAAADYSLDGREDLFVTNSRRQLHAVYRSSRGEPAFATPDRTSSPPSARSYTGWGASWIDLDLDGNLDLVLANGAIPVVDLEKDAEQIQVLENLTGEGRRGEFADAGALVGLPAGRRTNGRGLAAADYDNDGDVDVAINSIDGPLMLLRTTGAGGHWLEVAVDGFAPGTKVTVVLPGGRRLVREVHAGSSYLSSEDPRVHFGLGKATRVREVVARFPDGSEQRLTDVAADRSCASRRKRV